MDTNLSRTVDIVADKARYDASVKEVLADKQVLARILKYTLPEFEQDDIYDIIKSMDTPIVSKIGVDPGMSNLNKIEKTADEDKVPGEGMILYDIRFCVYHGEELIKILVNVEAQKSTNKSDLKYDLDNRIIYYLARMISSQKEVEFVNSNYDDIKHVRSIWICMDSKDNADSINRIRLVQENIHGREISLPNLDKVVGVVVSLRKNEDAKESKNVLIAMLEELLRKEDAASKKHKLESYGFVMTEEINERVNIMCNLSEVMLERGIQQGLEQGMEQGIQALVLDNVEEGKDANTIRNKLMKLFGLTEDRADYYLEKYRN